MKKLQFKQEINKLANFELPNNKITWGDDDFYDQLNFEIIGYDLYYCKFKNSKQFTLVGFINTKITSKNIKSLLDFYKFNLTHEEVLDLILQTKQYILLSNT